MESGLENEFARKVVNLAKIQPCRGNIGYSKNVPNIIKTSRYVR
jgi:hypothetical protein